MNPLTAHCTQGLCPHQNHITDSGGNERTGSARPLSKQTWHIVKADRRWPIGENDAPHGAAKQKWKSPPPLPQDEIPFQGMWP